MMNCNCQRPVTLTKTNVLCRDWSPEHSCSRNKVVESMGKTSLVLDMVDVLSLVHDSG